MTEALKVEAKKSLKEGFLVKKVHLYSLKALSVQHVWFVTQFVS